MRLQHFDVIESFLCVVGEFYFYTWPWARCSGSSASSQVSMPKVPATASGQVPVTDFDQAYERYRRPPADNATKHFEKWEEQGANFTWPENLPKSAVMIQDQSRPPCRTYSFLRKKTLTKNPIERSIGVFWALGGRRGGGFWVAL